MSAIVVACGPVSHPFRWWVFLDAVPFSTHRCRWQADRTAELLEAHGVADIPADASELTKETP